MKPAAPALALSLNPAEPHLQPGCLQQPAGRAHPYLQDGGGEKGAGEGRHPPFALCSCVSSFAGALHVSPSNNTAGGKTWRTTEKSPSKNISWWTLRSLFFATKNLTCLKWNWKPSVWLPFVWRKFCPSRLVEMMINAFSWHQANWLNKDWRHLLCFIFWLGEIHSFP